MERNWKCWVRGLEEAGGLASPPNQGAPRDTNAGGLPMMPVLMCASETFGRCYRNATRMPS